jgi:hypothetical protein
MLGSIGRVHSEPAHATVSVRAHDQPRRVPLRRHRSFGMPVARACAMGITRLSMDDEAAKRAQEAALRARREAEARRRAALAQRALHQDWYDSTSARPRPLGRSLAAHIALDPCHTINTLEELKAAMAQGDLSNCIINVDVTGLSFVNMNLRGAVFTHPVKETDFSGAHLEGASFTSTLNNVNFLYAHLEGADFSKATMDGINFAFATTDGSTQLDPTRATHSVFTDALKGYETISPMLLNTQAIRQAVTGSSDPLEQARIIRDLASHGQLFPKLVAVLPPGTMDRLVPREFRSIIYEAMRHHSLEFPDKQFAFDDANNHWKSDRDPDYWQIRPAGGPTLQWFYDTYPALHVDFDRALAAALLSDHGGTLADPIGPLITGGWMTDPYNNFNLIFADNIAGSAALRMDPTYRQTPPIGSFDKWLDWVNQNLSRSQEWNGREYTKGAVMLPWDLVDKLQSTLTGSALEAFDKQAADGVVSMNDLARLPTEDYDAILHAIYDIYGGP